MQWSSKKKEGLWAAGSGNWRIKVHQLHMYYFQWVLGMAFLETTEEKTQFKAEVPTIDTSYSEGIVIDLWLSFD